MATAGSNRYFTPSQAKQAKSDKTLQGGTQKKTKASMYSPMVHDIAAFYAQEVMQARGEPVTIDKSLLASINAFLTRYPEDEARAIIKRAFRHYRGLFPSWNGAVVIGNNLFHVNMNWMAQQLRSEHYQAESNKVRSTPKSLVELAQRRKAHGTFT